MSEAHPISADGEELYLVRDDQMRREYIEAHPEIPAFFIRCCGVGFHRQEPEHDFLWIEVPHDDEEVNEFNLYFQNHELITWMAGLALGSDRLRLLKQANNERGSFYRKYGWRPDTSVEDEAEEDVKDMHRTWADSLDLSDQISDLGDFPPEDWPDAA